MQSEVEPTLTEGSGKPPTKFCVCGNKMSGADSHTACIRCLGLEHTKAALAFPATCEHCARFSNKTRKRRLNKKAKLFADDPVFTQPRAPPPAYRIQKRQPHPTGGRPGPEQAAGAQWRVGEEATRARGAARWPCGPFGYSGSREETARYLRLCDQGGAAGPARRRPP
ncbi:unnamed protein product [Boreogadus saida]